MRITNRAVTQTALLGLNAQQSAVMKLQQQLTSGKQISTASDSPTGTNKALQLRQDQSAVQQYAKNISDGQSWLDATDTALTTAINQVQRIRDLTVKAMNTGSASTSSQQAISVEVAALRESLIGVANSSINGRPLFGGPTQNGTAYDPGTGTYVGVPAKPDGEVVGMTRRVSDADSVRIDITGPEAFGASPDDLFAIVGRIAADVVGDTGALAGDLDALDGALQDLLGAAASVGARSARMEAAGQVNTDLQLTLASQLVDVEDIDLARTIMELNQTEVGYKAALQATAQVIQPTLLDFLR
ncbi:flagellar hook-associated protein FlgL [Geodermatophilus sp. DSM 45219]|uniref:flagellar hook-associated protein FlgL n=1 Tax=Geodermatophilus sp. DSM 45219 TaxID=1881103 RepID=UPI000891B0CC|nr:flagellar hook-associated protein FlgL [Geodermatophilus sp. DSM 45219]SDN43267.1 flagellar hook-associated protein 3 FlgL [Geodermatophilus sp. DSM 45219]